MVYVFIILYLIGLVAISLLTRKKNSSVDDFLLGGRNMGPWISAFAYGTTYFSAVIFVGYAGSVGYANGISGILAGIGNAVIGSLFAWLILAKRTRAFTGKYNISTMPEFFEKRYNSKGMKIISAVIIFMFLVPYCASVYQGLSYIFEISLGIRFEYCIIAMAAITAIYLFFGGYFTTAFVNLFQGIIMIAGVVLMVIFIMNSPEIGGFTQGIARLREIDPKLVSFNIEDNSSVITMVLLTSLGSWGLPQMVHKFYTIKDEKAIKSGMIISTLFALLIATSAYFIGAFGRFFVEGSVSDTSILVPMMITKALPEILIGLVIALVLSASMSTLSSLVLVSASSIAVDLLKGHFRKDMSSKSVVTVLRVLCVVFVAVSLIVALDKNNAIVTLMSYSWGTISGCFIAPFVYGLYWKGMTKAGAISGLLCGLLVNLYGFLFVGNAALTGVASMLVSLAVVPVVSLCSKKYSKEFNDDIMNF